MLTDCKYLLVKDEDADLTAAKVVEVEKYNPSDQLRSVYLMDEEAAFHFELYQNLLGYEESNFYADVIPVGFSGAPEDQYSSLYSFINYLSESCGLNLSDIKLSVNYDKSKTDYYVWFPVGLFQASSSKNFIRSISSTLKELGSDFNIRVFSHSECFISPINNKSKNGLFHIAFEVKDFTRYSPGRVKELEAAGELSKPCNIQFGNPSPSSVLSDLYSKHMQQEIAGPRKVFDEAPEEKVGKQKKEDPQVYSIAEGIKKYLDHANQSYKNKFVSGFHKFDAATRGLNQGETLCIIGKAGVGKTAFLMNCGLNFTKSSGMPVVFFSMEMPAAQVTERIIQIETDITGYEAEKIFRNNKREAIKRSRMLMENVKNFYIVDKSGLTLKDIKEMTVWAEKHKYKKKTGLIMIDYLGLVKGTGRDLYERTSDVARGMKELAKDLSVPVIYLSQTTKQNSQTSNLEMGSARDSGVVDEASDFVVGLRRRKEERKEKGETLSIEISLIKNRRGSLGDFPVEMNKKNLRISEPGAITADIPEGAIPINGAEEKEEFPI